jgi:uncharacterized protein (DUF983 family)
MRAIRHGAQRRCPRCGEGPLFERWNRVREECPACGLTYLLNQGDPWAFLLFLDRAAFIFPPVAILYFRLLPESWVGIVAVFLALGGTLLYTTPHRYGICIALDWLTRPDDVSQSIRYPSEPTAIRPSDDIDPEHERG